MRRVVCLGALTAALALLPSAASAQSEPQHTWVGHVLVGPSFGDMGATAGGAASAGLTFGPHLRLVGEVGSFQVDRLDNAVGTTPPSALVNGSKAAAYHVNANIEYRFADRDRLAPYVTAGVGSFTSPTVGDSDLGPFDANARTRVTHAASNVGAGVTYRLTNWLGVGADYRYFVLNTDKAPHVNRFTTGVTFLMK